MKNTYCGKLWTEIYIRNNGDVFSCCNARPVAYGNIYRGHLRDIVNNGVAQSQRKAALEGRLRCYAACHLFDKQDGTPPDKSIIIDYGDLKILQMLFAEDCPIRCVMCRQKRKGSPALDLQTLIDNVDIAPFDSIGIEGGEPLFIPAVKRYFDYAAARGKKVSFKTNGLLIDDQWADRIALHADYLYVSLNGATKKAHEMVNRGSRWETVLSNVARVRASREKHHTPLSLIGHMTIVRENLRDIPLYIRDFKLLGFDSISFGYDRRTVPGYLLLHPFFKRTLRSEIRKEIRVCQEPGVIDRLPLSALGLV